MYNSCKNILLLLLFLYVQFLQLQEFLQAEPFLALTVHEAALKNAEIALREMQVWQGSHPEEYAAAKKRFTAYIEEIRSKEKFTFSNLF